MSFITNILATAVALEFFYIMYLETFATTSSATQRVFKMTKAELSNPNVQTLFKNQGIYNGLVGLLILIAIWVHPNPLALRYLMLYVVGVSAYGAYSSDPGILLKQGGLAIVTLISMILF